MDLQLPQEECDILNQLLLQEGSATSSRKERPNFNLDTVHSTPSSFDKATTTAPCTTTTNTELDKHDTTINSNSCNESNNTNKIIYNISKDTDILCLALLPSPPLVQQPSSPPLTGRSSYTTVEAESNKSNYNYNNNNNMSTNSNNDASGHNSDRDQVTDNNSDNRNKVIAVISMRSAFFNQGNII